MARITWYGHAAFLVEVSQKKILIDPWISNPLSPVSVDKVPNPDYIVLITGIMSGTRLKS